MTSKMVKDMSDNDLLDEDYFLHEDVFDEDESNSGFYISSSSISHAIPDGMFFFEILRPQGIYY